MDGSGSQFLFEYKYHLKCWGGVGGLDGSGSLLFIWVMFVTKAFLLFFFLGQGAFAFGFCC